MAASPEALGRLERALDWAVLWGLELDTRYRVLAGTFEVGPDSHPTAGPGEDHRLQVLLFPVADIAAWLRRETADDGVEVETFEVDQLLEVVASFGGATVRAPLFDPDVPGPDTWGPELSLEGRSSAPDGRGHVFQVEMAGDGGRQLDLRATFDDIRVNDAAGEEIELSRFR